MVLTDNLRKHIKTVVIHVIAWTIYMALGIMRNSMYPGYHINVADTVVTELPMIIMFYLNYVLLLSFLGKKKYFLLLLSEVLLFVLTLLMYYVTGYVIGPAINQNAPAPPFVLAAHIADTLWLFMIYGFFSYGYYFAKETVRRERQLRKVDMERLKMEQDKLRAEYAFLRSQINPHFLHNTLNFFYAKSLGYSKELSDGILTLCEIMRYSLSSGEDEQGMVLLSKELEHVQHVIKINQLRFSNRLQVDLAISGNVEAIRIIPLVLITLVENAFKHGELTNKDHPLVLRLEVDESRQTLLFSTSNRKKTGPRELSHGIGIDNIRKRLAAVYKDACTLDIKDEADHYTAILSIHAAAAGHSKQAVMAAGANGSGSPTLITHNRSL